MICHQSTNEKNIILRWMEYSSCPTECMNLARIYQTGRYLSCPSSPAPQDQFVLTRWDKVPLDNIRHAIKITVDKGVELLDVLRGGRACYIRSDTVIKRHKSPMALVCPDSLDKSALVLRELLSWAGGELFD